MNDELCLKTAASWHSVTQNCDAKGNITALIDSNGNIVARYEYDAYGKIIGQWGIMAAGNVYRFSSKESGSDRIFTLVSFVLKLFLQSASRRGDINEARTAQIPGLTPLIKLVQCYGTLLRLA